jgi:DNA-binding XRE family transcriptional regulator
MVAGTIQLGTKRFVVLPELEYDRMRQRLSVIGDVDLPELPAKLPSGNYPAIEALRAGLARKLIKRRWAVGLSQAEVARRAGVRAETINRIERAKVTADTATITKIDRVLEQVEREESRRSVRRKAS